jgi:hypothetical protein
MQNINEGNMWESYNQLLMREYTFFCISVGVLYWVTSHIKPTDVDSATW